MPKRGETTIAITLGVIGLILFAGGLDAFDFENSRVDVFGRGRSGRRKPVAASALWFASSTAAFGGAWHMLWKRKADAQQTLNPPSP